MSAKWVQACTPGGVQKGVQKWWFVRAARRARNPKIVHPQFLPATKLNVQLNERSVRRESLRDQGLFVVSGVREQARSVHSRNTSRPINGVSGSGTSQVGMSRLGEPFNAGDDQSISTGKLPSWRGPNRQFANKDGLARSFNWARALSVGASKVDACDAQHQFRATAPPVGPPRAPYMGGRRTGRTPRRRTRPRRTRRRSSLATGVAVLGVTAVVVGRLGHGGRRLVHLCRTHLAKLRRWIGTAPRSKLWGRGPGRLTCSFAMLGTIGVQQRLNCMACSRPKA